MSGYYLDRFEAAIRMFLYCLYCLRYRITFPIPSLLYQRVTLIVSVAGIGSRLGPGGLIPTSDPPCLYCRTWWTDRLQATHQVVIVLFFIVWQF